MSSENIEVNELFSQIKQKIKFAQSKIGGNFVVTDDANKKL